MPANIFSNSIFKQLLPLLFLTAIISSQYFFDLEKMERPNIPPTILPVQVIKLGDLGLHSAASALMWLYTIQQIPIKTAEMIQTVNGLDPKFSYPYAFAAFVLPTLNNAPLAVEIAEKGLNNADADWRIPFYLATTNHIFLKDRNKAALYFDIAANTTGAPDTIKSMSVRYNTSGFKANIEQNKLIWISVYETSDDEIVKERALKYLIHLEIAEALEKAASSYKQKYGHYPLKIDDLVASKIIKEIPVSPLGFKYELRSDGTITIE